MNDVTKQAFQPVRFTLTVQFIAITVVALLALWYGQIQAKSLVLGALVFVIPNLYFTHYAFRYSGADASDWIKQSFLWGQTGKLLLAIFGFALVFRYVNPLAKEWFFTGYILLIILQWWLSYKLANTAAA